MKRIITFVTLVWMVIYVNSIPVKRGTWSEIRLITGELVRAQLMGDEYLHYMQAANGKQYIFDEEHQTFKLWEKHTRRQQTRATFNKRRRIKRFYNKSFCYGKKKILLLLVQFADMPFAVGHTQELYNCIANQPNFQHELGFKGSVHDYFENQSNGQFLLSFNVKGPITLPHSYTYYGENNMQGEDKRVEEMVKQACKMVDKDVNFTDYDWNNDGEADGIYILYAGQGENSTYATNTKTIWPHQGELADTHQDFILDGIKINTYACSSELVRNNEIDGIGTICHEITHLLGLPDMYDTSDNNNYGMCTWDVMDSGGYNGKGFVPAGYTSYERMYCGWIHPTELSSDREVKGMRPLSEQGSTYIIYNSGHRDEYYLLENRQKTGWDACLDGEGLLILHVDYNHMAWQNNAVNVNAKHQHCTIFHADNRVNYRTKEGNFNITEVENDAYPYKNHDFLTATSQPAATFYHATAQGTFFMDGEITCIQRHEDKTISFNFSGTSLVKKPVKILSSDGILFHESFDKCKGKGGNSAGFRGRVANNTSDFIADNEGWFVPSNVFFGGDRCAKFGTTRKEGCVYSPEFNAVGNDTLIFVAAPFGKKDKNVDVHIYDMPMGSYLLKNSEWTTVIIPFRGKGLTKILFVPNKSFFLDDVKVIGPRSVSNGITTIKTVIDRRIYNLQEQYVGDNLDLLPSGVYIRNGEKVGK